MRITDVQNRETGRKYSCIPQMVDLNFDGKMVMRYNIIIDGWHDLVSIHCIYSDEQFNKMYEVIGSHEARNENLR